MSLDNTGGSLTDVKNVVVGGLPILLGDTVKVGNGIAQRFCEFALTSGAHEGILDRLVIPEQMNLKRAETDDRQVVEGRWHEN